MIDRALIPRISHILADMEVRHRHGRACCPIHGGDNPQAFSYDDDKGVWYCFRCGFGGDAVELVKKALQVDFIGALKWLGLKPDFLKAPDPAVMRRQKIRANLREWAHRTAKELRYEHYVRMRVEHAARRRLRRDAQDPMAWEWLQWAYTGLDAIAHTLDMLEGTEEQQVEAYKFMRTAA